MANRQTWILPVVLEGVSVRLEPLERKHAPDLFAAADPALFDHTPQHPPEWSVAGFEREIESVLAIEDSVALAIVLKSGPRAGRAIGRSTYMDIKAAHRGVEVGRTWIGRAYHGTRVNPEIKLLMLGHAFEGLSPTAIRVQLTTGGTNLHSQAAITKLGATLEGRLRHARIAPLPGGGTMIRDQMYYSILAAEWPRVREGLERRIGTSGDAT